jgi:hypothetical protein
MSEPIVSPLTRNVLDLFGGPLREVRFPDADVDRLSRAVDEAEAAHETLVRAELAVQAAREALAEKRQAVDKQTERTMAYARIYAADRPELLTALESLTTPPPRRGRGRPRKDGSAPVPRQRTVAPSSQPEVVVDHEDDDTSKAAE